MSTITPLQSHPHPNRWFTACWKASWKPFWRPAAGALIAAVWLNLAGCGGANEETLAPDSATGSAAAVSPQDVVLAPMNADVFDQVVAETVERGQVLVVDFWGTWCGPCVALFDPLHASIGALGDQARLISVASALEEDLAAEKTFLAEHNAAKDAFYVDFEADEEALYLRASKKLREDPYAAYAYPMVFVYDAQGNLAAEFHGGEGIIDPVAVAEAAKAAAG